MLFVLGFVMCLCSVGVAHLHGWVSFFILGCFVFHLTVCVGDYLEPATMYGPRALMFV